MGLQVATVDEVVALFADVRFNYRDEIELQDGIEHLLTSYGVSFSREARIGFGERVDFLIDPGIALEVKIKGTAAAIFRQLYRYARCSDVSGIVVVHADQRFRMDSNMLRDVDGRSVPIRVAIIQGSWF